MYLLITSIVLLGPWAMHAASGLKVVTSNAVQAGESVLYLGIGLIGALFAGLLLLRLGRPMGPLTTVSTDPM